jgi:hypothetical protein
MNGPFPALAYVNVACELYPDLAPQIREGIADFYANQSVRCGEHLVQKGILTIEQNQLVLLAQKAQKGLLDAADKDELAHIQAAVHLRTLANLEELGMLIRRIK